MGCRVHTDPFADANAGNSTSDAGAKEYVHIRVQQRNGRKSLTTVQGLKKEFSYSKILKDLKKEFCCNGTVVEDPELGQVSTRPTDPIPALGSNRAPKERDDARCNNLTPT
ncbi:unnamed protein product [Cuscuta campestris]|uniref:SUI1 domain-containing protein n=1 Tax=Cuscuta campestris TaxID=132261 RepID=A0A484K9W1_9ASTE|nr:unnamed protein product [Cuscuta campestris]